MSIPDLPPDALEPQPPIRDEIIEALREFANESVLRSTAPNPDLCAKQVQVVHVLAIDLAEIAADPPASRRILQHLRANDTLFDLIKGAIVDQITDCTLEQPEIERRETAAKQHGGKRVWTDQFLARYAPINLPCKPSVRHNGNNIAPQGRLDPMGNNSALHFVRLAGTKLQMFRDGTICFTLRTVFDESPTEGQPGPPASVSKIIARLAALGDLARNALTAEVMDLLRNTQLRKALSDSLSTGEERFELAATAGINQSAFPQKAKMHTVIFVERFYNEQRIGELYAQEGYTGVEDGEAQVPLHTVLASSSLAGILNTAKWFPHYNSRYASALARKDVGYRDDEIYLTDRKATLVSAPGLWDENDSLNQYLYDIILAVEYNVSRLAYFASTLAYYQEHANVSSLENADPREALPRVIEGRAILSLIGESLDLTLLIDHGFTRKFVKRLRDELEFETAIGFIRQRVEDASTTVGLRSSVNAAENTSRESLEVALQGNAMQGSTARWTIAFVLITIMIAAVTWSVTVWVTSKPVELPNGAKVCLKQPAAPGGRPVLQLCTTH